jgi:hypothetical protein
MIWTNNHLASSIKMLLLKRKRKRKRQIQAPGTDCIALAHASTQNKI